MKFTNESGKLKISDPCYEDDSCGVIVKAKKGEWVARTEPMDNRVGALICCHKDYKDHPCNDELWESIGELGVDSGQMGVFDNKYFNDDSTVNLVPKHTADWTAGDHTNWYRQCCELTLEEQAGALKYGVVSSSGYGDGSYNCKVIRQGKEVVAIMVGFGLEEEDRVRCDVCQELFDKCELSGGICDSCHSDIYEEEQLEEARQDEERQKEDRA